jgi:S-adenosylmethionine:tRNA ribosyltransferase-isomerase
MKLSEFKFDLPAGSIALYPAENRDESRLMVIHKDTGKIEHKTFKDVVDYFSEGDALVINDTKVFPAGYMGIKKKQEPK